MEDKKYIVYAHISPTRKVYIGITCQVPYERRWGRNGVLYKHNQMFWNDIKKYGWSNFEHSILFSQLDYESACCKEKELIAIYRSTDPYYGYNHSSGGTGGSQFPDYVRKKISDASKKHWSDPEYKKRLSEKLSGKPVSDDVRRRISESNKRTKRLHPKTTEQIERWRISRGYVPAWNRGLKGVFHHSDDTKRKIGDKSRGKHLTDEQKRKISKSRSGFHHTEYSKELLRQAALNMSEEQRASISESVKKRWQEGAYRDRKYNRVITDEYREHMRVVAKRNRPIGTFHHSEETKRKLSISHKGLRTHNSKYVKCVETGIVYPSIHAANKALGITTVGYVLNHQDRSCTSNHFHFVECDQNGGDLNV